MTPGPPTEVEVEVPAAVVDALRRGDPDLVGCRARIADELTDAAGRLGVVLRPDIRVRVGDRTVPPIVVTVAGRVCRATRAAAQQHLGRIGRPWWTPTGGVPALLDDLVAEGDPSVLAMLLASVATETVLDDAGVLMTRELLGEQTDAVLDVVGRAAELGYRVDGPALDTAAGADLTTPRGVEDVLDVLAPKTWSIVAHPDHLDALAEAAAGEAPLASLAESLFTRTGVRPPRVTLVDDPFLPEYGIALVTGGRRTPPMIGHDSGNGMWAGETLLLLVERELRERAVTAVTLTSTREELDLLELLQPELVAAIGPHLAELTRLRRALVGEGVCVRDLGEVVQAMLDETTFTGRIPADDDLLRRARVTLGPLVTASAAGGEDTLRPRAVPDDLLGILARDDAALSRIADFVDTAVAQDGPGVVLVVPGASRGPFRDLLAWSHRTVPVLAEEEVGAHQR